MSVNPDAEVKPARPKGTGKGGRPRKLTTEQDAAVVALSAEGNSTRYIAERVGVAPTTVNQRQHDYAALIERKRTEIMHDRVEDYTRIITKAMGETERRIDEEPGSIEMKDLLSLVKVYGDKRNLILGNPTTVHAFIDGKTGKELDSLASDPADFRANLKAANSLAIEMMNRRQAGPDEVIADFEVVESGGNGDGPID